MVKKSLFFSLCFLISAVPVFATNQIWPGLYGHGAAWSLSDAPGTGDPKLFIINTLNTGAASGSEVADYNGTGQTAYVGNFRYAIETANEDGSGDPNGKVILLAINGTFNNSSGALWYLGNCDYTLMDFNPPGITDGAFIRNIKLASFNPGGDRELTHFFLKDYRCLHGSGANGDGGVDSANDTIDDPSNRKCMSLSMNTPGDAIDNVVIYKSTFGWAVDGPIGYSGGSNDSESGDMENITIADSIIAKAIAYNSMGTWDSGTSYDKWNIVTYNSHYYESKTDSNQGNTPSTYGNDTTHWRSLEDAHTFLNNPDAWKGLTSGNIDGASYVRNIFAWNNQRNPRAISLGAGNLDNNILYNSASLGMHIDSINAGHNDDYQKLSIYGNVSIGGPDSGFYTDEKQPNIWATEDDWQGVIVIDSNNNGMSNITNTSFDDTSKSWTPDEMIGYVVRIISGTGERQDFKLITDNDSNTVTIAEAWDINPDGTSDYEIQDLSNHDIYIADNILIECVSTPCATNYTTRSQTDNLTNPYDWDYVDNREEIPEAMIKHTSVPTGAHVSGYTPLAGSEAEAYVLANAGAYAANRDDITVSWITDITNRTDTADSPGHLRYRSNSDYLTDADDGDSFTATDAITLDVPTDWWNLCDNGYTRLEHWLHNSGSMSGCETGAPIPPASGPSITYYGAGHAASHNTAGHTIH